MSQLRYRTAVVCAALAAALALMLGGCGPKRDAHVFKVALLTTGPVNDHGWNEAAYDGLLEIRRDTGAQISNQVTENPSQFPAAFQGYASQGYNLILAHGDEYSEAAAGAAAQFPATVFVTTGGNRSAANLAPLIFETQQGTYLQGMQAGFLSKTGKGGFVGGESFPPVSIAADAFAKGMAASRPGATVAITYIHSWNDAQKAKAQTEALMSEGVDVISHNCDAAAAGLFQSADKPGIYTFGVNSDQNTQASNVFSSTYLDIPHAFASVAASVETHRFKGEPMLLGMKEGDVRVINNPRFASLLTPAQRAKISQAQQRVFAGTLSL
jgi:basic membrane lipoprotein Med (substrate-binding protein (PBP1-ABC) superfamily)